MPEHGGDASIRVKVLSPRVSDLGRSVELPCSAHWYESADLYAKVSGYLDTLNVDIGSRVKAEDPLATIDAPELDEDVLLADASLQHQLAVVKQFEAKKQSAVAEHKAALAACEKAEADVERWDAEIQFRDKEYRRLQALSASNSVQAAIVDEKLFQLQSVQAGKRVAETAILMAKEQAAAAGAMVELADADIAVAQAQTQMEESKLKKAKLMASFSKIESPFNGVVTARHYHPGEFIRAADKGASDALLTIGRTDLVRVVVHIPDRDVPFANPGDSVEIVFDTLPGRTFTAKLSRIAYSEDVRTRAMRAEVDLKNEESLIVDQMYGQIKIQLVPPTQTLTLPAVCLVGDLKQGTGQVFIVEDGMARLQSVSIGQHDGIQVEVIKGLTSKSTVIVRAPAGLADGSVVSVDPEVAGT
jgi:RND family efflux transporter MFP subunit